VAVEMIPLFPGSCLGVLPTPESIDPSVIQSNLSAEYSEERHAMTLIVLGVAG
jgi:hypothetical protein